MKFETEYKDINFLTGENKNGIKEKNLSNYPVMKGLTKIQMLNVETGEVEREVISENLIKDTFYSMVTNFMRAPFTNLGMHDGESYYLMNWCVYPQWIYLLNDPEEPVETVNEKDSYGETIGYSSWYSAYSNTGEYLRGTVVPNLCCSFPDVTNQRNIYRMVFEFPQYCANGTFNKIQIRSRSSMYHTNPEYSRYNRGERVRGQFKGIQGEASPSIYMSSVHNGWFYWMDKNDVYNKNSETKVYKANLSKLTGVISEDTITSEEITEVCRVDLSSTNPYILADQPEPGFSIVDDTTAFLTFSEANGFLSVKEIDLITGAISDFGTSPYAIRGYYTGGNNYNYNRHHQASLSPDGTKIVLMATGYRDYNGGSFRIYNVADGALLYNGDRFNSTVTDTYGYHINFVDNNTILWISDNMRKVMKLNAECTAISKIFDMSGDIAYRSTYYNGLWDRGLQRFFAWDKTVYTTINLDGSSIFTENALPMPITKTDQQIMRVQYDFIVPWLDKTVIYDHVDYEDLAATV